MFQTKVVERIKRLISFSITYYFFKKSRALEK